MKDDNFTVSTMTESEKEALSKWQERIDTETGEIEPEKTFIQEAKIVEVLYSADMSNDEYHNGEREFAGVPFKMILSAGKLKACKTPLHYQRHLLNPPDPSLNLNNGSAFHSMILEPDKFEYELFDDTKIIEKIKADRPEIQNVKATKEYKDWFSQFKDDSGNLRENVLTKEAFQTMWSLKKKLSNDRAVFDLFNGSNNEQSIFVNFDGLRVKVRPDGLKIADKNDAANLERFEVKAGDLIIISVKTTIDASPAGFLKQCIRLQYHIGEAFYFDVIERYARQSGLIKPENSVKTIFLTLEKEKNEFTGHYMLRPCSKSFIDWGRRDYAHNLSVYMNTSDFSEGYEAINEGSTIAELNAPSYER